MIPADRSLIGDQHHSGSKGGGSIKMKEYYKYKFNMSDAAGVKALNIPVTASSEAEIFSKR